MVPRQLIVLNAKDDSRLKSILPEIVKNLKDMFFILVREIYMAIFS